MFFFFLFLINFSLFKFQIYSITNSSKDFLISQDSQNLLFLLSLTPKSSVSSDQFYLSQFYNVDQDYYFTQSIDTQNNDLSVMNFNFKNIYFNGERKDYLYKFNYEMGNNAHESIEVETPTISNKNKLRRIEENSNENDNDAYKFECKFIYGGISTKNFNNLDINLKGIKKVLNLHKLIIVLGSDKMVYRGSGYQNLNLFYENNNRCFNGETIDIFVSKNFLIIENEKKYCIFELAFSYPENDIKKTSYSFVLNNVKDVNKNVNNKILQCHVYNNIFYVSLNNTKKISAYNLSNFNEIKNFNDSNNDDYIDFVVFEKTLYAIEKKFGLVIFNLEKANISNRINLKNSINIDKFINPFNGKIFVGIFLNNSNLFDDFFIELYVENNNEENPYLNKIFVYKYNNNSYNFSNYLNYDGYFSYFFDNANNNIIILRRGLVSHIHFYSYIIPLNSSLNNYSLSSAFIAPFKPNRNYIFYPIIIFPEENVLMSFDEFKFNNNSMNCCFYKDGTYSLFINHFSDFCSSLYNFENKNNILCNITSTFRFKVIYSKENNYIGLIIGLIVVVIVFCALGIAVVYMKDKNENLNLKVKSGIDKNDKKNLYIANNGYNQKRNNKNTTKQFNCNELVLEEERILKNNDDHNVISNGNNNIIINHVSNNSTDTEKYNNNEINNEINNHDDEIIQDSEKYINNNNNLYLSVNKYNIEKKNNNKNNNNEINNDDNNINNNDNDNDDNIYNNNIFIRKSNLK